MIWTTTNVHRIILDMAGHILQHPHLGLPSTVSPTLDLARDLGINSLQRMMLAAHLNEFFELFSTSKANYLLASTTLDHWTCCIMQAREETDETITFRSSGTSGAATPIQHSMASLLAEARFLTQLLPKPQLVVSCVAAQHIYGFLFTIVLPALWNCPVRLLTDISIKNIGPDTLMIGTPFTWDLWSQSMPKDKRYTCQGVCSTAPLHPTLFSRLEDAGVSLLDIYGSSETGGLGYRIQPNDPFRLFPYWQLRSTNPPVVTRSDTGTDYTLPDRIEPVSAHEIRPKGRLDESIQIAGVNVYPGHIQRLIATCPLVDECDVYAKSVVEIRNYMELFVCGRIRKLIGMLLYAGYASG